MINEGNISNAERTLRQVRAIIQSYRPKVDMDSVSFAKTSKGNWMVRDINDRKICVISKFIMSYQDACDLGYCKNTNESNIDGLVNKNDIIESLNNLGIPIKNCIVRDNGTVDLIKDTTITNKGIKELGIQFGSCKGNFDISGCKYLESLMGCPDEVFGNFNCGGSGIRKLLGCPDYVHGDFLCEDCTKLISCKDAPINISGNFVIGNSEIDTKYLKKVCKIKGDII